MLTPLLFALGVGTAPVPACPDSADTERFLAQWIAALAPAERVPRGALVVVCGDRQRYAGGFGRTRGGAPVDPERTLFRAASNSKLVTATAAMQLVAAGHWRLGDDVNRYLPPAASLADGFGRQVTIADLLTHTAGFEDKFAGGIALAQNRLTLGQYFARNRPRRVRPAGEEVSYSNVGIALAGYAVEGASAEPFDQYAQKHIFAPLGMARSTFAQPVPDAWQHDLASGLPPAARGIVFLPYPAASLVTTPADMGRFIAAHLSAGATSQGRILPAELTAEMHQPHWRAQPGVPGVAYGFFEGGMNGRRTLFHTGDSGDHSVVFLLPDDGVGFYFVYGGTDEQAVVRERFTRAFMDRFFSRGPLLVEPVVPLPNVAELAGRYRGASYSHSNYEKLKALFNQLSIGDGGNGTLLVTPPGGGEPLRLTPRAPLVFAGDSGETIAFRRRSDGVVAGFTLSGSIWDPQSFDRIGTLEDGRLHVAAFGSIALVLLLRLLLTPASALVRRVRRRPKPSYAATERRWWRWSGVVSLMLFLTPFIGLGVALLSFRPGAVAIPRAALVVGIWLAVVSVAGLTLVAGTALAWRRRFWSVPRRISFTLVALGLLLLGPLLAYWRVIPI